MTPTEPTPPSAAAAGEPAAKPAYRPGCGARLALVAIPVVVVLLLLEVAVRLVGVGSVHAGSKWYTGGNHPRGLVRLDARSGYSLTPGFRGEDVAVSGEFRAPLAIDADGLRDHPHHVDPRAPHPFAGRRILAVGDSMTYGEGVAVTDAWPAVLEARTGALVVNGGVPGYGVVQMVHRAQALAPLPRLAPGPDIVLVAFQARWDIKRCSDPFDAMDGFLVSHSYRPRLHLVHGNVYEEAVPWPVVGPLSAWLQGWSQLARAIAPAVARLRPERVAHRDEADRAAYRVCLDEVARVRDRFAPRGTRLVVVLADSLNDGFRHDTRLAARGLRERGVETVVLDGLLDEQVTARRFEVDPHWNVRGHREVGEALARWLATLEPPPPPPGPAPYASAAPASAR